MSVGAGPGSRLARRARAVEPFHVMRLLARARDLESAGRRILHLEVGEPDFPTPGPIVAAGQRALTEGLTRYTPAAGLPALRDAIARYYGRRYGLAVDPKRVIVTPGASGALQIALLALLEPGEGVMISDPSYPCYRQVAPLCGVVPRMVPLGPATGHRFTREVAEPAWVPGVRALLLATPANPTGSVLSAAELRDLHALCLERDATLIVDEIYQGLVYGVEDHSALALGERGLMVFNSFSKLFGMTGWRVGWIVAPRDASETLDRLAQNLFIAAATPAQHAALAAFDPAVSQILEERRDIFARRRAVLLRGLCDLGFQVVGDPVGAFYVYARMPNCIRLDSMAFATRLLEDVGVAVTPGADFGLWCAERHLRFAYTRDVGELTEALERLRGALTKR